MDSPLTRVTSCMYVDEADNKYFCVEEFLRNNQLPDTPLMRKVVADEFKQMFPGILILEEQN